MKYQIPRLQLPGLDPQECKHLLKKHNGVILRGVSDIEKVYRPFITLLLSSDADQEISFPHGSLFRAHEQYNGQLADGLMYSSQRDTSDPNCSARHLRAYRQFQREQERLFPAELQRVFGECYGSTKLFYYPDTDKTNRVGPHTDFHSFTVHAKPIGIPYSSGSKEDLRGLRDELKTNPWKAFCNPCDTLEAVVDGMWRPVLLAKDELFLANKLLRHKVQRTSSGIRFSASRFFNPVATDFSLD